MVMWESYIETYNESSILKHIENPWYSLSTLVKISVRDKDAQTAVIKVCLSVLAILYELAGHSEILSGCPNQQYTKRGIFHNIWGLLNPHIFTSPIKQTKTTVYHDTARLLFFNIYCQERNGLAWEEVGWFWLHDRIIFLNSF